MSQADILSAGERPMAIELKLKRANGGFAWIAILLCLLTGGMGVMKWARG